MMNKRSIFIITCFLTMFIFVMIYYMNSLLHLVVINKNELFDGNYQIGGGTNCDYILIYRNRDLIGDIPVTDGKFLYNISEEELSDGWNEYELIGKKYLHLGGGVRYRCMINKIPNQANAFLPEDVIIQARTVGNERYHYKRYEQRIINDYSPTGSYFINTRYKSNDMFDFDDLGIILLRMKDKQLYYQPVTISQQALAIYHDYLNNGMEESQMEFIKYADWLVENQAEDGSYPYPFSFEMKPGLVLPKGFVSSMAQGQVLSVLERAYNLTNDVKYADAGGKAFQFMITPAGNENEGCLKTLEEISHISKGLNRYADNITFEEYISASNPNNPYILNGTLFALMGLYDWSAMPVEYRSLEAKEYFDAGIKSIEIILPYYDYYGWSSYDLMQYTCGYDVNLVNGYSHDCHIYLLNTLSKITGSEILRKYCQTFMDYVDNDFWRQTDKLYYESK